MHLFKRSLFYLLLTSCLFQTAFSQDFIRLRGRVVEEESKELIPFVTVQIKGVALGTITEEDGRFAVKIPLMYANDTLIFSSVGYLKREVLMASLQEEIENEIILEIYIEELDEVTVVRGRERDPLRVLKKAIRKIKSNYPKKPFTYDAYYREQIVENGATIKFADAATTFQQSGYTGKRFKQSLANSFSINFRTGAGTGLLTGGLFGLGDWGERLHDHFGHRTASEDRVKIHDSRASLNLTKESMEANIEGGPLSTLSKDLVRYISHFMNKKEFKKYTFELYESPDEEGNWDYVVRFKPKKAPATLEKIQADQARNRRISRTDILSGAVHIDQDSYAIKRITYSVEQNYRRHICNLQEMNIKHYGYEIDVKYKQTGKRWQLDQIKRIDEFIYKDTIKEQTTPYATITELFAINDRSELLTVSGQENFANVDANFLYDYPLEYNKEFWDSYQKEVPLAQLSDKLRSDMETTQTLEKQFSVKHLRDESILPPVAEKEPVATKWHGTELVDDYQWLKDPKAPKKNQRVMDYLVAENKYAQNYFIPLRKSQRQLTNELYRHMDQEAKTEPVKSYGYWYWSKYEPDDDYRTIYRKKDEEGAGNEILFDQPALADSLDYFSLGFYSISPDNQFIAYSIDTVGRQSYMTYIKNLETGEFLGDSIKDAGGFLWAEDSKGFFHSKVDKKRNRSYAILFHNLGTSFEQDSTYMESDDTATNLGVSKSRSKEYLFLYRSSNNSNAVYLSRNKLPYDFKLVKEAEPNKQYSLNHVKDHFYISTNLGAENGRLMITDTAKLGYEHWKEIVSSTDDVILMGYRIFNDYLVVHKMENMKERIELLNLNSAERWQLNGLKDDRYNTMSLGRNEFDSDTLHYYISAPNYNTRKVSYHMGTRGRKIKQVDKSGGFFVGLYRTKRIWADARDGTKIPITLVYLGRKEKYLTNRAVLVDAYGAYGSGGNLGFNSSAMPLLSRGVVYAYVHVRGGGDLGDKWYQDGKMMNKMNTFNDLIDAVEYMKNNGLGHREKFFGTGGSAGGLLMGAVVNQRPDLFQGVFLDVPFVDVINTMGDESLPLTAGEYQEWGNPQKKKEFKYILQYSPYENVKAQDYPRMAFYAGINDKNVGYWEPAKMVARLRALKTDNHPLILNTGMNAGHGAGSGRMASLSLLAYKYALMLEWLEEVQEEILKRSLLEAQSK